MKNIRKRLIIAMLTMVLAIAGTLTGGCTAEGKGLKKAEAGEMTVHFLDVGQGLSILAQSEGETLLYDGGDRHSASFVVSYLKKQNVETINYLISSHYDADHVSGLVGCLNAFDIEHVIGADYVHDSDIYRSFMEGVKKQGLEVENLKVGTEIAFGSGKFTILSPKKINKNESNENSVAIKLTNGDHDFLFMGDAEYKSEEKIISSGIDLDCEVLSVGHHGSASSTSWEFLQECVPEYAVISCGAGNQYGHPDADTMEKFSDMEIEVFRSDKQGTIVCTSDGEALNWSDEPCNDYTPGDPEDEGTQPSGSAGIENSEIESSEESDLASYQQMVWIPKSGKKYHSIPDCGKMNPDTAKKIPLSSAKLMGYSACKKCN